ncbi:Atpob1 [Hordeum vulgare]|nr:Atpob1 [Hordeum vulgare]
MAVRLQPPPPPPTPTPLPPPPPPTAVRGRWWAWTVVAGLGGVVAVSFLAVTVAAAVRWSRRHGREDMDVRALAREELGKMAVRGSRMPTAKMVRTQAELENGSPLAWRR